jgi:hypothetical protein
MFEFNERHIRESGCLDKCSKLQRKDKSVPSLQAWYPPPAPQSSPAFSPRECGWPGVQREKERRWEGPKLPSWELLWEAPSWQLPSSWWPKKQEVRVLNVRNGRINISGTDR